MCLRENAQGCSKNVWSFCCVRFSSPWQVLTIATTGSWFFIQQVRDAGPTAHRQPLRDPFQAQRGFPAQPPSQLHLLLIALAPPLPFLFVPAQTLEFLSHDHFAILGLLPAPTAGFSDVTSLYVAKYGVPPMDSRVVIRTRQQVKGWEGR
jgi:hypothetical protein